MIDLSAGITAPAQQASGSGERKVLHMERRNDRTAGSMPVWTVEKTVRGQVADTLALAQAGRIGTSSGTGAALAYHGANVSPGTEQDDGFGFADLLDIVNPLQHIPLVGTLYRNVTGDEIKPVSRIIGGGVFGGVAGLAGSAVNVIVEEETGRDVAGNVLALALGDDDSPASRPARMALPDRPASASAFADTYTYAAPVREPVTELIFWNSERIRVLNES